MPDFYYWLDELAEYMQQFIRPEMTDEQIAEKVLPLVRQVWHNAAVVERSMPGGVVMEENWSSSMKDGVCAVRVQQRIMLPIRITISFKKESDG